MSTIFLVPRVQERVLGIRSVDQTAQFRIISWNNAIDIFSEHPYFGVGYNHYKFAQFERGFITDTSEHSASGSDSSLLTIIVTTGAIGALFYLWFYASACWEFLRTARASHLTPRARAIALGSLAAMIGLFVHSQFVNGWFYPHIMETTWLLLAMTLRERNV
jgi:O-antigen ligase